MYVSADLLVNALFAGLLLGGFYAAVTVGISISFGILDIVNIAHPAFVILGSYIAYIANLAVRHRSDHRRHPGAAGLLLRSAAAIYQVYYLSFEKRGQEALRGLAFFFGLLFITEVVLILVFGVDYRYVQAPLYRRLVQLRPHPPAAAHAGAVPDVAADAGRCCSST